MMNFFQKLRTAAAVMHLHRIVGAPHSSTFCRNCPIRRREKLMLVFFVVAGILSAIKLLIRK